MVKLKMFLALIILTLSGFFIFKSIKEPSPHPLKVIAISQIVEHPSLEAVRQGIYDVLSEKNLKEGRDYKLIYKNAQGNMGINNQIAQQFVGIKPDVMVAISTPSAQALATAAYQMDIPLVFAAVTDPLQSKLIKDLKNPGNFISGVSDLPPLEAEIELIRHMLPRAKTIGIIYNPAEVNSAKIVEKFKTLAQKNDLEVIIAPTTKSSEVLFSAQNLVGKVDAFYIPQDNTVVSAISSLIALQFAKKIPCFTSDEVLVEKGALGAVGTSYYQHGRQAGKIIIEFLKARLGQQIPIAFPEHPKIYINQATAVQLNLIIPYELSQKATFYKYF